MVAEVDAVVESYQESIGIPAVTFTMSMIGVLINTGDITCSFPMTLVLWSLSTKVSANEKSVRTDRCNRFRSGKIIYGHESVVGNVIGSVLTGKAT